MLQMHILRRIVRYNGTMKQLFRPKEARIPFTKEGYQKVLDEKNKLLTQRPEAVEHLRKSREMGDLSENGYYRASRAKLSSIDARLRHLERLVRLGRVMESTQKEWVEIGSSVRLSDGEKELRYTIVGGYESNPSNNTISHKSPIGRALIGKKTGETIQFDTPSGIKRYTILSIY